jgi:hypothetical protein
MEVASGSAAVAIAARTAAVARKYKPMLED